MRAMAEVDSRQGQDEIEFERQRRRLVELWLVSSSFHSLEAGLVPAVAVGSLLDVDEVEGLVSCDDVVGVDVDVVDRDGLVDACDGHIRAEGRVRAVGARTSPQQLSCQYLSS